MEEAVVKATAENLSDLGSDLPESFSRLLVRRLESFGCQVADTDQAWNLAYAARQMELEILDYCHIELIPSTLYQVLCDRACGRYLYDQKQSGNLELEGLDLSGALSSIKEGDVSLSFASGGSDAERLEALLGLLMGTGKERLTCYRKIKW